MSIAIVGTFYKTLEEANGGLIKTHKDVENYAIVPVQEGFIVVEAKQLFSSQKNYESYPRQLSIFRNQPK